MRNESTIFTILINKKGNFNSIGKENIVKNTESTYNRENATIRFLYHSLYFNRKYYDNFYSVVSHCVKAPFAQIVLFLSHC